MVPRFNEQFLNTDDLDNVQAEIQYVITNVYLGIVCFTTVGSSSSSLAAVRMKASMGFQAKALMRRFIFSFFTSFAQVCLHGVELDAGHTGIIPVPTRAPVIGELGRLIGGVPQQDSLPTGDELVPVPVVGDARHDGLVANIPHNLKTTTPGTDTHYSHTATNCRSLHTSPSTVPVNTQERRLGWRQRADTPSVCVRLPTNGLANTLSSLTEFKANLYSLLASKGCKLGS
ncbi:hypothetical protein E2C01_002366 [Portunus trituberculatus]|uniref:Uncharacterized protein n=1 Tax=Portunus trituberculatus TaxID=210409 RepID=A0A5B7CKT0_PORTR|nr:hypothetical protein [Portunus trituberculatus]